MRKTILFLSLVIITFITGACVSSKNTVAQSAQLNNYDYVSVVRDDVRRLPSDFANHEILFFDAVEASGKKLINEERIYELTPAQKSKLLLVRYELIQDGKTPQVVLTFTDYGTGRPVVACKTDIKGGILDFGKDAKITSTMKRLAQQVHKAFYVV